MPVPNSMQKKTLRNGLNPLAYEGVEPSAPSNFTSDDRPPISGTTRDYQGFNVGDEWLDRPTLDLWKLVSKDNGVATWQLLSNGNVTLSLTPDVGGSVFPLAGDIRVSGAHGITTVGNLPPHNLTITLPVLADGEVLIGVTGTGIPVAATLTAGANVAIAEGPGTITISAAAGPGGDITLVGDGGTTATSVANSVNVLGTAGHITAIGDMAQTLTLDTGSDVAISFPTDSGIATPAAGILNILAQNATLGCGATVLFSAPGPANTVQLNVTDAVANTIIGNNAGNLTFDPAFTLKNTILGADAGTAIDTTSECIFIGYEAGNLADDSQVCTLIGHPGFAGAASGSDGLIVVSAGSGAAALPMLHNYPGDVTVNGQNIFCGRASGNFTIAAFGANGSNSAYGDATLTSLTTGFGNSALGRGSLYKVTTGAQNIGIGIDAGFSPGGATGLTTGICNVLIGPANTGQAYTGAESYNVLLSSSGVVGESNILRIGDGTAGGAPNNFLKAFIHGIRGVTTDNNNAIAVKIDSAGQLGTVSSSRRFKDDIVDMGADSENIFCLRPVSFVYKEDITRRKTYGLIAEEVKDAFPYLCAHGADGLPESVHYDELPALMLNELIKLRKRVEELESKER